MKPIYTFGIVGMILTSCGSPTLEFVSSTQKQDSSTGNAPPSQPIQPANTNQQPATRTQLPASTPSPGQDIVISPPSSLQAPDCVRRLTVGRLPVASGTHKEFAACLEDLRLHAIAVVSAYKPAAWVDQYIVALTANPTKVDPEPAISKSSKLRVCMQVNEYVAMINRAEAAFFKVNLQTQVSDQIVDSAILQKHHQHVDEPLIGMTTALIRINRCSST